MRLINNPLAQKAQQTVKRTLPEVGRISIGEKGYTADNRSFPKSTDYFVFRSKFERKITELYGEKPTELPIFFYTNDVETACSERLEIRDKTGALYAYGDGENFWYWDGKKYEETTLTERPKLVEGCVELLQRNAGSTAKYIKWAHVLTMRFCLKDVPVLGYWQFSTKGEHTSIPNLRGGFDGCSEAFGGIKFLPFTLTIKKVKSNKPGVTDTYPVVDLVPMFSMETGLKIRNILEQNPEVNPAQLALMDLSKPLEMGGSTNRMLGSGDAQ